MVVQALHLGKVHGASKGLQLGHSNLLRVKRRQHVADTNTPPVRPVALGDIARSTKRRGLPVHRKWSKSQALKGPSACERAGRAGASVDGCRATGGSGFMAVRFSSTVYCRTSAAHRCASITRSWTSTWASASITSTLRAVPSHSCTCTVPRTYEALADRSPIHTLIPSCRLAGQRGPQERASRLQIMTSPGRGAHTTGGRVTSPNSLLQSAPEKVGTREGRPQGCPQTHSPRRTQAL